MARKPFRSPTEGGDSTASATSLLSDLPRRQFSMMTRCVTAVLDGSQAVRAVQQEAAHRAAQRHVQVLERLRNPCDVQELVAIQSELVAANVQEAMQYWQQLGTVGLKAQVDWIGNSAADMVTDTPAPLVEAHAEAEPEPTLEALQKAFENSLNDKEPNAPAH